MELTDPQGTPEWRSEAPITDEEWADAQRVVRRAVRTSLHCSIASTNDDGSAHVTAIGSLQLTDRGSGYYFDVFNTTLARNVLREPRVTIAAVDSGKLMWLRSLLRGKFAASPGLTLVATVGPPRPSTPEEVAGFHRLLGPLLRTRGGRTLWSRLPQVRDLSVHAIRPIRMGAMTRGGATSSSSPRRDAG